MPRFPTNISFAGVPKVNNLTYSFLPYGSNDSSVILQHSLTSLPTAAELDVATVSELDSAITFNAAGMTLGTNRLRFTGLSNSSATEKAKLNSGFQVSFDIKREGICQNGTSNGSSVNGSVADGDAYINQFIFQLRGTSTEVYIRLLSATQNLEVSFVNNTVILRKRYFDLSVSANPSISSVGKGEYVTVNLGAYVRHGKGYVVFGLDGVPLCYEAWTGPTGTIDNIIDWNSRSGAGNVNQTRPIKNIQVCNKGPAFPLCHDFGKLVIWGDSQPEGLEALSAGAQLDADMGHTIARYLWANGVYLSKMQMAIYDNGGGAFADPATGLLNTSNAQGAGNTYASQVTADEAITYLAECYGTNDAAAGSFNAVNFQTAYENWVDDVMLKPNLRRLVLCTVPSLIGDTTYYNAQTIQNTADINAIKAAQPARWAAANPGSNKDIVVADLFTLLGGETAGNNYWIGEVKGTMLDFHHTDLTHYIKGNAIGSGVLSHYSANHNRRSAV